MSEKQKNCLILIVLTIYLTFMISRAINMKLPEKIYGVPIKITETVEFAENRIDQILDDGDRMYVMIDDHNGYIQVFDLDGHYQYTLSFYNKGNGALTMAIEEQTLYVFDRSQNVYVFQDGEFLEFIEYNDSQDMFRRVSLYESSERYDIRYGSVWRIDGEQDICVIKRSFLSFIYQYHIDHLFLPFVVLVVFLIKRKRK